MKPKPDAAARLADWIDSIANADFDKTGVRPYWLPLKVYEGLQRRIRRLISREVRAERERCVNIVKQEHTSWMNVAPKRGQGAWACENILAELTKGPK